MLMWEYLQAAKKCVCCEPQTFMSEQILRFPGSLIEHYKKEWKRK